MALSLAQELVQRHGHGDISIYHLLLAVMESSSIKGEAHVSAKLETSVAKYVNSIPFVPVAKRAGFGTTPQVSEIVRMCHEEAVERHLDAITPVLLLYILVDKFSSIEKLIADANIGPPEFKEGLEKLLSA